MKCCGNCKWGRWDGCVPPYVCDRQGMDTYGKPHEKTDVCEHWKGKE